MGGCGFVAVTFSKARIARGKAMCGTKGSTSMI